MSSFAERLQQVAAQWSKAKARTATRLPAGKYQVSITQLKLAPIEKGRDKGCVGLAWFFLVETGPNKGKRHAKYLNLERKWNGEDVEIVNTKTDFAKLGIRLSDKPTPQELLDACARAKGMVIEIQIAENKRNPAYVNTYINRVINAPAGSAPQPEIDETLGDEPTDAELEEIETESHEEELDAQPEPPPPAPAPAPVAQPAVKRGPGRPKGSTNGNANKKPPAPAPVAEPAEAEFNWDDLDKELTV